MNQIIFHAQLISVTCFSNNVSELIQDEPSDVPSENLPADPMEEIQGIL